MSGLISDQSSSEPDSRRIRLALAENRGTEIRALNKPPLTYGKPRR